MDQLILDELRQIEKHLVWIRVIVICIYAFLIYMKLTKGGDK